MALNVSIRPGGSSNIIVGQGLSNLRVQLSPDASFPPTTNIALWLKADGLIGLNNGDSASVFTDYSGLGRNFTATGTARPTYRTAQQNGLPGVDFNGTTNVMTGSLDANPGSYSLFMVLKMKAIGGNPTPFRHGTVDNLAGADCYACILNGGLRNFQHRASAGTATNFSDGAATTNWELWTLISTTTPTQTFRLNGSNQTLSPTGVFMPTPTAAGVLGAFVINSLFASCIIGEVLLYKADVGTTNRDTIETALKSKWGL